MQVVGSPRTDMETISQKNKYTNYKGLVKQITKPMNYKCLNELITNIYIYL